MVRLYLFGEGKAEQAFAKEVLEPHLMNFGVTEVHPILISNSLTKDTRGGWQDYEPFKQDLRIKCKNNKGPEVFFTTMVDLYGIPDNFPDLAEADKLKHIPYGRVARLESAFAADIGDRRFIPHLQLHEFETMLLCDPECFAFAGVGAKQLKAMSKMASSEPSPELIDGGQHSAPSKRIQSIFPEYMHLHGTLGPELAQLIGLPTIRAKCPHFDSWIAELEALAAT